MTLSGPSKPIPDGVGRLAEYLHERVGDQLRSVVWYDPGDFELVYVRDDVRAEYSEEELDDVIDELTLESLASSIKEDVYVHGGLRCIVECYEDGIEMHFIIDEGEGIAIGLEATAFVTHNTFIGKCLEEVELDA